ncbi:MAG TPA: zf-HC2 domain-containing protein [Kofleriaceae bacterium]
MTALAPVRHVVELTCADVVERVSDLLGSDMPAQDRVRLEQHLLVCPPCTSHVQQMRDTIALARETHPAPIAAAASALEMFAKWKASAAPAPAVARTRTAPSTLDETGADGAHGTAYKFLRKGAFGPMSGCAWPTHGAWMSTSATLVVGRSGLHVCRQHELANWLHDELWEVEVAGVQLEGPDCVVVERARTRRRIDAWSSGGATRFAAACIARARELVGDSVILRDGDEALHHGYAAVAAFNAAFAVAKQAPELEAAFAAERRWQSDWITREIVGG